ncbi:MAG TPA: glycoside hydrolase family 31 protein [Longimicrobiales bacterium]
MARAARAAAHLAPAARPLPAGYTFLGDLESYERTDSGVLLRCAPGAALRIRFVTPGMFRVTLDRDDRDESLLAYPLVAAEREPVALRFEDEGERLVLRSERLTVVIGKAPCRLTVRDRDGTVLSRDDPGLGIGWDGNEVRNWKTIGPEERFFGLGEKTGDVDKRGREWVMWNSDTYAYGPETDPVYQSIPFFIGLREGKAYGIYLNNSHRTTFNLGAGNHRYYSFAAAGGALDYFFIEGPRIADVVSAYTALTGRPPLPPKWALGYQQSRWSYYPAAEVLRLARTFREKRIPADVIYLDVHYMDGYRVFTWDPERFPDPADLLATLDSMGFKVVTIIDPGVKADSAYAIAREGLDGGHFVRYPDGEVYIGSVWPGKSYFPDFSRPETQEWWGGHVAEMAALGVDGFWNDMNEPAVWGKAFPLEVLMEDGGLESSQKKMHNLYGFLMAQATYRGLRRADPDRRPFILTRAGFAGGQRYAAVWTGDNVASWDHLALGIRMMLGLGLSGVPFVGTDVGGFVGSPAPELFARWIQVGVFSPFFRTHTAANTPAQEPWSFGEYVEDIARESITLRYRLLPYLYTLFREANRTGSPILRPLFWHYQADPAVYRPEYQHQFLVGAHLLVAPVIREGQRRQEVYLPAGRWLDLHTERVYEGGQAVVVDAPLERVPMFLAAGGILPTQEPVQYVGERASRTLFLDIFPAPWTQGFDLYEDDGVSYDHEHGEYRVTRFEAVQGAEGITILRELRHDGYDPGDRTVELRVHAVGRAPAAVTLDGAPLPQATSAEARGYIYDAERRVLTVRFREAGARQEVRIR